MKFSRITVVIREIKICEIENGSPFVKYTTVENNHLYTVIVQVYECVSIKVV